MIQFLCFLHSAKFNFFHVSDFLSSAFKHGELSLSSPSVFDSPSVYHPRFCSLLCCQLTAFFSCQVIYLQSPAVWLLSYNFTKICSQATFTWLPMTISPSWVYLKPNSTIQQFLLTVEHTKNSAYIQFISFFSQCLFWKSF